MDARRDGSTDPERAGGPSVGASESVAPTAGADWVRSRLGMAMGVAVGSSSSGTGSECGVVPGSDANRSRRPGGAVLGLGFVGA